MGPLPPPEACHGGDPKKGRPSTTATGGPHKGHPPAAKRPPEPASREQAPGSPHVSPRAPRPRPGTELHAGEALAEGGPAPRPAHSRPPSPPLGPRRAEADPITFLGSALPASRAWSRPTTSSTDSAIFTAGEPAAAEAASAAAGPTALPRRRRHLGCGQEAEAAQRGLGHGGCGQRAGPCWGLAAALGGAILSAGRAGAMLGAGSSAGRRHLECWQGRPQGSAAAAGLSSSFLLRSQDGLSQNARRAAAGGDLWRSSSSTPCQTWSR